MPQSRTDDNPGESPADSFVSVYPLEQAEDQENRAREIADTWRRYLIGINSGAIVVIAGLAGALAGEDIPPKWAVFPLAVHSIALAVTGYSFSVAKHKAFGRRDAYREGRELPDYNGFWWRNTTYDTAGLTAFVAGAFTTVLSLWCFT